MVPKSKVRLIQIAPSPMTIFLSETHTFLVAGGVSSSSTEVSIERGWRREEEEVSEQSEAADEYSERCN